MNIALDYAFVLLTMFGLSLTHLGSKYWRILGMLNFLFVGFAIIDSFDFTLFIMFIHWTILAVLVYLSLKLQKTLPFVIYGPLFRKLHIKHTWALTQDDIRKELHHYKIPIKIGVHLYQFSSNAGVMVNHDPVSGNSDITVLLPENRGISERDVNILITDIPESLGFGAQLLLRGCNVTVRYTVLAAGKAYIYLVDEDRLVLKEKASRQGEEWS